MASSVLKEFLVSVGFDVDENSYRRFRDTLAKVSTSFEALATEAVAASLAVAASVNDIAGKMDNMYFASIRTGASVTHLTSFAYAMSQIGVDAGTAMATVERFASVLRTSPGMNGLLGQFGIDPRQGDPEEKLLQLVDRLRRMPYYMAAQYGKMFGIDESSLNLMIKQYDTLQKMKAQDESKMKAEGRNPEQEARDANKYETHLRELQARLRDVEVRSMERFLPLAERVLNFLDRMSNAFFALDKATNGWTTRIGELVAAIGALRVATGVFRGLLGLGGGAAEGAGVAGGVAAGGAVAAGAVGVYELHEHKDAVEAWGRNFLQKLGMPSFVDDKTYDTADLETFLKHAEGFSKKAYQDAANHWTAGYGHLMRPGEKVPTNEREASALLRRDIAAAAAEIQRTVKVALTSKQMAGLEEFIFQEGAGRFEKSILPLINSEDLAAAAAKMQEFSKYHNKAGQLVDSKSIRERRDWDAKQLAPVNTVNQKVEINVNGSQDPHSVAEIVLQEQRKTNADVIRQMQGVAR